MRGPFWSRGVSYSEDAPPADATTRALDESEPACLGNGAGAAEFYDPAVTPASGDKVMLLTRDRYGHQSRLVKILADVRGEWFLCCEWATFPLSWVKHEGIGVRVARVDFPEWSQYTVPQMAESRAAEIEARNKVNAANRQAIGWLLKHGIPRAA
jgi:hypothetical protein